MNRVKFLDWGHITTEDGTFRLQYDPKRMVEALARRARAHKKGTAKGLQGGVKITRLDH